MLLMHTTTGSFLLLLTLLYPVLSQDTNTCTVTYDLYERNTFSCKVTVPQHVSVICSPETFEVQMEMAENYNEFQKEPLRIDCQSGYKFFLNESVINWKSYQYEIKYGNKVSVVSQSIGQLQRHSFSVQIFVSKILDIGGKDTYHFYTYNNSTNNKSVNSKSVSFNITVVPKISSRQTGIVPSTTAEPKDEILIAVTKKAIACTTDRNHNFKEIVHVNFSSPEMSQNFISTCNTTTDIDQCVRNICKPDSDCSNVVVTKCSNKCKVSNDEGSKTWKLYLELEEGAFDSGVVICTTKEDRKFLEYFTALDGETYPYKDAASIDHFKLIKVKPQETFKHKLYYPEEWITLNYKVVNYHPEGDIYWDFQYLGGHFDSFVYGDSLRDWKNGTVQIQIKKNVKKILYFLNWTPFPIGSFIEINVASKRKPQILSKKQDLTAINGKPFALNCEASGIPVPLLSWTKDDKSLSNRVKVRSSFRYDKSVSILEFSPIEWSDDGKYTCEANNSQGNSVRIWSVSVASEGIGYEGVVGAIFGILTILMIAAIVYSMRSSSDDESRSTQNLTNDGLFNESDNKDLKKAKGSSLA